VPCRVEHPVLMRLAEEGVAIFGINYKDPPDQAKAWLAELGDPFEKIGADRNGRVGIEWGVYGVPETFVVDAEGRIRHRHVGPIQARDLERTLLPILAELSP
jgi:cytochrome c biogenesis protein CcmG/thiol:disulfide interchange protein DsbE